MAWNYGRCTKGQRVYQGKRQRPKQSEKYTWISALCQDKIFAHFELNGSMTAEAFLVYVQQIFLPPYSPDFSPIEECWSKFKSVLKQSAARTKEHLNHAVEKALESITQNDMEGWFRHFSTNIQDLC